MTMQDGFEAGGAVRMDDDEAPLVRALAYLEALTEPLSWLDEQGYVKFNAAALSDFTALERMENLHTYGFLIADSGEPVLLADENPEGWEELKPLLGALTHYSRLLPGHEFPKTIGFDEELPPETFAGILERARRLTPFAGLQHSAPTNLPPVWLLNSGLAPSSREDGRVLALEQHGLAMLRFNHYLDDDAFLALERVSRADLKALAGRNLRRFSA